MSRSWSMIVAGTGFVAILGSLLTGCRPTPGPGITLISPNGGEVWVEGQTYEIKWSASGIDKVGIDLATGGHDLGHIVFEIDASMGKYGWTIPQGLISQFGIDRSDEMRMMICSAEDPAICDENDQPFTVVKGE